MSTRAIGGRVAGFTWGFLLVWVAEAAGGAPAPAPAAAGPHAPAHQVANLGDFRFEDGTVVKDFKVSYVTHGKLNGNKDNAILVLQHFVGDHHDVDFLVGRGKGLDPDRYFIVAPDFLGNANLRHDLTTGPTNSGLKMGFPRYTIRDSVNVEHRLLTGYLGIDQVLAATGASIGAMKAYQLAVSYPSFVKGIIPIAGSPATGPLTRAMLRNWMDIIQLDPGWYGGNYEDNPRTGLVTALMNFVPALYAPQWFAANLKSPEQHVAWERFWRDLWAVHAPQDARDVHYQLRSWAEFNVGDSPGFKGDARAALRSIKAQALIISSKHDPLVSPEEISLARTSIPRARHLEIDSPWGHLICCGFDPAAARTMDAEVSRFLESLR